MDSLNLKIVLILCFGFGFASILGYLSYRIKLSPIVGYLIAGYLIGPYSPGFIADIQLADQLAEIGVILMMFGVGLHFKWQDLANTSRIAIPGAIIQILISALAGAALIYFSGWSFQIGIIFGLAVGVASTVVLVYMLTENDLLNTPQGYIAMGWLIVEDMITVVVLLLIAPLAVPAEGVGPFSFNTLVLFGWILIKFVLLVWFMFTIGLKIVSYVLTKIKATKSHEMFTLSMLAITFVITVGSSFLLGTSIALGAFIAGMVIGQTKMRNQVSHNAMPLKDVFSVIFFLAIGMIFNPAAILERPWLFLGTLGIILVVKPLVAFLMTLIFKYPLKVGLTIAVALAQIGEFSFILAEEAMKYKLLPDEAYDIIVACSLISIAINPFLFRTIRVYISQTKQAHLSSQDR